MDKLKRSDYVRDMKAFKGALNLLKEIIQDNRIPLSIRNEYVKKGEKILS